MALYLGNQKVSLRSGQDPTFDYGFDSNGRLVFANKNATEINNFLNYDSTYSEILDLSNLSKMEKVAVNGTADRKMEGLKGLLVSQNAPFTGSSPQINASYTGLNKSALVSLFESAPYNVGYTVVGSPTITDGVASNLDRDNYLRLTQKISIEEGQDCEMVFKIHTPAEFQTEQCVFSAGYDGFRYNAGVYISSDGRLFFRLYNFIRLSAPAGTILPNTTYYVKGERVKGVTRLSISEDNQNWTVLATGTSTIAYKPTLYLPVLGHNLVAYKDQQWFTGSIDLNETYIKVNGVPWFGPGVTKNLVPDGTVVGDVIVKDGVASGFSSSDYLKTSQNIQSSSITSSLKVFTKFTTSASVNEEMGICGNPNYFSSNGIFISSGKLYGRARISMNGNTTSWTLHTGSSLLANTTYYAYTFLDIPNKTFSLNVSTDKLNWTTVSETKTDAFTEGQGLYGYQFGETQHGAFNGSIDLNNTYIKVGSDYFYRGMVPMTKTCSIVGATGTADLTQEDKNIILNKGWNLTVQ